MEDVTQLLQAVDRGDSDAIRRLLAIVYAEMRTIAAAAMANETPGHTLVPTALVHEAYLRLVGSGVPPHFETRGHFFAAVAEVMRRILIDHARKKNSQKRGGGRTRDRIACELLADPQNSDDWLDLHEALTRLEQIEPEVAKLVKLRYFAGLTIEDAAETMGVSNRTAVSWWTYARTWLASELRRGESPRIR